MRRRRWSTLTLVSAVAFALACGDQQEPTQARQGPELHTITGKGSGCDITHLSQLVNSYFAAPRRAKVQQLVTQLDGAQDFSTAAKNRGFDILANVDTVVNNGTAGDSTIASDLVNHVILCMYDPTTSDSLGYPATFPEDFTISVTASASAHGTFRVKPSSSTDAAPVLSRPESNPFSGVIPNRAWSQVVGTNNPVRVLVYGKPGVDDQHYDWKSLPHTTAFDSIVVAVCLDAASNPTSMVNEENVGALPFVDVTDPHFLTPGTTCSPSSMALGSLTPSMFARAILRKGAGLFSPSTLLAAAMSPGGIGGSTGALRSNFGPDVVPQVNLEFVQQPSNAVVNKPITPFVTIKASEPDGTPVGGVKITLLGINNNGAKVVPAGNVATTQLVTVQGKVVALATFNQLAFNKPGGYALQIQPPPATQVLGRATAVTFVTQFSNKFNEAPK